MNRRTLLQGLVALAALPLLPSCSRASDKPLAASGAAGAAKNPNAVVALDRPHAFWRDKVSPAAFDVLFKDGTERPGSSPLDKERRDGTFVCAACHLPLFDAAHKYDSRTGWPSFTQSIRGHMGTQRDFKMILPRNEYHCARCGGHQGHIFDDGPPPLGKRWCNNGVALRFVPKAETLPTLRG
ncbi:MAG: peptide-methionine (R)-S-oxide reductase MsrB [Pseudomonadota bacterium]|nr:peptide-methionine (R)-S-oxide reductase MsrB [Pseudomonadota bacterium]